MPSIERGDRVKVETAFGDTVVMRAVTGVTRGYDFPVVSVCREEEWEAALREGREPDGVPCPARDVHPTGQEEDPSPDEQEPPPLSLRGPRAATGWAAPKRVSRPVVTRRPGQPVIV